MSVIEFRTVGRSRAWRLIVIVALLVVQPSILAATQEDADTLLAAEDWQAAVHAYGDLLAENPAHGNNWFQLGQANEQLSRFSQARDAYQKAIERGFQPLARARFALARISMALNDSEAALSELEAIAETGGPNFRTVQNAPAFAALAANPRFLAVVEALKPCTSPDHRKFDFWLGEWDVTAAGATSPTATSRISSTQDGCVVMEEYTAGAFTGISLSFFDAVAGYWHQTWMSNAGGALYMDGNLREDGAMEMSNRDLPISATTGSISKTVWTPLSDGSVQQVWTNSTDNGESWTVVFDGNYKRRGQE